MSTRHAKHSPRAAFLSSATLSRSPASGAVFNQEHHLHCNSAQLQLCSLLSWRLAVSIL